MHLSIDHFHGLLPTATYYLSTTYILGSTAVHLNHRNPRTDTPVLSASSYIIHPHRRVRFDPFSGSTLFFFFFSLHLGFPIFSFFLFTLSLSLFLSRFFFPLSFFFLPSSLLHTERTLPSLSVSSGTNLTQLQSTWPFFHFLNRFGLLYSMSLNLLIYTLDLVHVVSPVS